MTDSALIESYERHRSQLIAFVAAKVGCAASAADIVQDTYLRLVQRSAIEPVANPQAFVYRVAHNLALDHLRQVSARGRTVDSGPLPEDTGSKEPSAETRLIDRQRLARLNAAIAELPPRCQAVFVLRKVEGLDQAEIAARLRISRNMVEKHLRKALIHCMARLEAEP